MAACNRDLINDLSAAVKQCLYLITGSINKPVLNHYFILLQFSDTEREKYVNRNRDALGV